MYIKAWDEFQSAAEALYAKSPDKARYCVKWRSTKGELVLKITDDVTCIKYKSKSSIILNRFDALTLSLMRKMQNVKAPEPAPIPAPQVAIASSAVPSSAEQVQSAAVAAAAASATQDGAAGGVKKKKPKKKK